MEEPSILATPLDEVDGAQSRAAVPSRRQISQVLPSFVGVSFSFFNFFSRFSFPFFLIPYWAFLTGLN